MSQGVLQDITSVFAEGTDELGQVSEIQRLSRMAFDAEFKSVYNTFSSIDSKIEKDEERSDFSTQRDLMELQAKMGVINNPMNYLTPILIATLVIVAVLAALCMCGLGFCWYVRFHRKKNLQRNQKYNQDDDREHGRNGHVSLKNINEEKVQFINNIYKTLKMREKQDSAGSSEVNVPLSANAPMAGEVFGSEEFTPMTTPSRSKGYSSRDTKYEPESDRDTPRKTKRYGSPPKKNGWDNRSDSDEKGTSGGW